MIRKNCSFLASLLLLPALCLQSQALPNADDAAKQGVFIFGNSAEPPSIDPQLNTSVNGSRIVGSLMEGLISYHPKDDNIPEPGVAKAWSHDGSYITWTFHLRDAKWSNGDPVTAHDFTYSYRRMLSADLGARYAELLYIMKNARAFHEGEIDFEQVGVKAINNKTLLIELEGPTPHFLNMLKHSSWFPVHPPTIEAAGGMTKQDSNWTRDNYVGNGAFRMKSWEMNKALAVEKNPLYWDAANVRLNEIHFIPTENSNTDNQNFENGANHYVNTVPSDLIPIYQEHDDPYLRKESYLGTYYYKFNTAIKPLNDKRVRKALALAINQRAIVRRITRGGQLPAGGFTPPGIADYEAPQVVSFNPRKARELLAEAGFPGGEGMPKLSLIYNTSEAHKDIAEAIQQMWKSILGVEVELRNQEWKVFLSTLNQGNYDIARAAWIGDYMYPDTFLLMWRTGDGNNNTGWGNTIYDQLLADSFKQVDATKRLDMLHQAEGILLDEMPIAPIYHYTRIYRIDTRIKGWHPKLLDNHPFKYVYFEN